MLREEVGVLLTQGDKAIYASLRSKGDLDVALVAQRFGGDPAAARV